MNCKKSYFYRFSNIRYWTPAIVVIYRDFFLFSIIFLEQVQITSSLFQYYRISFDFAIESSITLISHRKFYSVFFTSISDKFSFLQYPLFRRINFSAASNFPRYLDFLLWLFLCRVFRCTSFPVLSYSMCRVTLEPFEPLKFFNNVEEI